MADEDQPWRERGRLQLEAAKRFAASLEGTNIRENLDRFKSQPHMQKLRLQIEGMRKQRPSATAQQPLKKRRGRPRGSPYEASDLQLIAEIETLVKSGEQLSRAQEIVALQATGSGTHVSKITRLRKLRTRRKEGNGA